MPFIQWYPGHIAKAERKLQEKINLVDVILEVIDARIPSSSIYEDVTRLIGNKPRLLILNKADLSDSILNTKWRDSLAESTGLNTILTSASSSKDISSIIRSAIDLGKPQIEKLMLKGILPRPIRIMVIGMPNVGKSSLINKLIKCGKAKTGAKAGITRAAQWIRIHPKLELLDMPGIIPMKLDNQERAMKLAMVNSISENAYDNIQVAEELISLIHKYYPELLIKHYNLKNICEIPTLTCIATARNWLLSEGIPDINRCASVILTDFRHGRLGRITLEHPKD